MLEDSRIKENLSLVFLLCMVIVFFATIYFMFGKAIMFNLLLLSVYIISFSLLGVVIIYSIYTNPPAQKLREEMQLLKKQISELEKKFLKREMPEQEFLKLLSKKHHKLIKIESKVYKKTSPIKLSGLKARLLKRRERAALKRLLEQKEDLLRERRIAASKLYRRQIDRDTFQKFIEENDDQLVKIESLIKILFAKTREAEEKQKRKEIIKQLAKGKPGLNINRMAEELLEQMK